MESDRSLLEDAQRDRDRLASERVQLNSTITQQEDDAIQLRRKVERLTLDLEELGSSNRDEAEVRELLCRKTSHDGRQWFSID